jgi:predicted DNA binding CopG/RHH family protein
LRLELNNVGKNGDIFMAKKKKFKYGKVDLLPGKIQPKDVNIRISIVREGDLLDAIKARAAETGIPYQTLIQELEQIAGRFEKVEEKLEIKKRTA